EALEVAEQPAHVAELGRLILPIGLLGRLARTLSQRLVLRASGAVAQLVRAELAAQVFPRECARFFLALDRGLVATLLVLILRPCGVEARDIIGRLRRRQVAGRRHDERRPLLVIDPGVLLAVA